MSTADIRYYDPDVHSMVHVTDVTMMNSFLFRPSNEFNDLYLGVFGWAQKETEIDVIAVQVMSSHHHLILRPEDHGQLSEFMCLLKTNLAKEVKRLYGDWEYRSVFDGRFHAIPVSHEEKAQVSVFRYVLANGVKELLVDRAGDWPGVQSVRNILYGERLVGHWYDRTKEFCAHQRGEKDVGPEDFATEKETILSRLPCWAHLSAAQYRRNVQDLIDDIEEEGARERRSRGKKSMGVKKILAMDPYHRAGTKKSRRKARRHSLPPRFHAATEKVLRMLYEAYSLVFAAYRDASDRLLAGDRSAVFPSGTFPPHLPFVTFTGAVRGARGQPA